MDTISEGYTFPIAIAGSTPEMVRSYSRPYPSKGAGRLNSAHYAMRHAPDQDTADRIGRAHFRVARHDRRNGRPALPVID